MNAALAEAESDRQAIAEKAAADSNKNAVDLMKAEEKNQQAFAAAQAHREQIALKAATDLQEHKEQAAADLKASVSKINNTLEKAKQARDQMRDEFNREFDAHKQRMDTIRSDMNSAIEWATKEFTEAATQRANIHSEMSTAITNLELETAATLAAQVEQTDAAFAAALAEREEIRQTAADELRAALDQAAASAEKKFNAARTERNRIEAESN